jgi:two-component system, sensor histidine kinase and response regulator
MLLDSYPHVSICQPFESALRQQVEQERLLNQVTTQIRKSLELPVILQTAVQEVRRCLHVDRLVIYQFNPASIASIVSPATDSTIRNDTPLPPSSTVGQLTYESLASASIPSTMNWKEEQRCFAPTTTVWARFQAGHVLTIADTEAAYQNSPCLLQAMRQLQVRSKLAVSILVQEKLWGLLIAHQCTEDRVWLDTEQQFLQHIAEHLAIAIHQAQLYAQLQQQKQNLEQQVVERTRELRDTLLAAQAANRAKSEFLTNVSHEFRTPLTSVIGMSDTLLHWSLGGLSAKQRHYLSTIRDSGKHLLALVNDVLDLSQLEAGKLVLRVREFSLTQVAQQTLQTLQDVAKQKNISIKLEVGTQGYDLDDSPPNLLFRADRRRVKQILSNLLGNAIKFTPSNGQVTLRVWLDQNQAVLQIEDTGIGIPADQLPNLFQKFYQLDSSYHREYGGTGLGLALTKQLVELHGGRIEVESQVGQGSTFTVGLLVQPLPEATMLVQRPSSIGQIILIESQEEIAKTLCEWLTDAGYQVIWLVEGLSAVRQIQLLQPQLVILDMQLDGVDGTDILQQLRSLPSAQSFQILALLAQDSDTPDAFVSIESANHYLCHPLEPYGFLHIINRLLVGQEPT